MIPTQRQKKVPFGRDQILTGVACHSDVLFFFQDSICHADGEKHPKLHVYVDTLSIVCMYIYI